MSASRYLLVSLAWCAMPIFVFYGGFAAYGGDVTNPLVADLFVLSVKANLWPLLAWCAVPLVLWRLFFR